MKKTPKKVKPCKVHNFARPSALFHREGVPWVTEVCKGCGFEQDRKADPKKYKKFLALEKRAIDETHGPVNAMEELIEATKDLPPWDRIQAADKLAKEYHGRIKRFGCDDQNYTNSALFFVDASSDLGGVHGTWVFFFPQCSGDPISRFFLYPSHMDGLLPGLVQWHLDQNHRDKYATKLEWDFLFLSFR